MIVKSKKQIILAVFMACISIAVGIWLGMEKDVWYCDEAWTYESANSTWKENIYNNCYTWISGDEISSYLSATERSMNFGQILDNLYTDHVPLYFWLFRIVSVLFFFDSSSIWVGTSINIVIYAGLTVWLFFKIDEIYNNSILSAVIAGLFLWTVPMTLDHVTLIRMYLMLFAVSAVTAVLMLKLLNRSDESEVSFRYCISLLLTLIIGFLTHYYYWPFAFIIVCSVLVILLFRKKWKDVVYISITCLIALVSATAIDKGKWIENILLGNESTAVEQLQSAAVNIHFDIKGILYKFGNSVLLFGINWKLRLIISILVIASVIVLLWKEKKKNLTVSVFVVCFAVFAHALVISAANVKDYVKYYWPPLMGWNLLFYTCLGYLLNHLFKLARKKENHRRIIAYISYIFGYSVLLFLAAGNIEAVDGGKGLDYLGKNCTDDAYLKSVHDLPWIVYSNQLDYNEECLVFDLKLADKVCFMWNDEPPEDNFKIPGNTDLLLITRDSDLKESITHLNKISGKKYNYKFVDEAYNTVFSFYILSEVQNDSLNNQENKQGESNRLVSALDIGDINEGDTFYFGSYEQDNDVVNGKEAILWRVIAKENNRVLLLSEFALETMPYNQEYTDVLWSDCTLNIWMNGEFLKESFSDDEKKMMESVDSDSSPIFLLSTEEVNQYLQTEEKRQCRATPYAISQGAWCDRVKGNCWWWLSSSGIYKFQAAFIETAGHANTFGNDVDDSCGAVRPAMWISCD